jgi:Na+-transporting NADH:ubiquinone oxidoreductase subunit A
MSLRVQIKHGLDIPISGAPEQSVYPGSPIHHLALCGLDYPGLKPKVLVTEGDKVGLGGALFVDKRDPVVQYCSPGQGTVVAINRGARRILQTIVIRLDTSGIEELAYNALTNEEIQNLDRDGVASRLHESGLWTAFRTRPYSRVPLASSVPRAIFVTAIDTQPLATDPQVVIRPEADAFANGLQVVSHLTAGAVNLCTGSGWNIPVPDIEGLQQIEFIGPHPAGLPGTHIHHLDPVGPDRTVWHIGYQDVIAIGKLFTTGKIHTERVIALSGDPVSKPRLISTRLGASTEEILKDETINCETGRVVSGSVLTGRLAKENLAYLGRYHIQLSIINDDSHKSLFGWLGIRPRLYTTSSLSLKKNGHKNKWPFTTALNGRYTGMLPIEIFDNVVPLDMLLSPLLRAWMNVDSQDLQYPFNRDDYVQLELMRYF